jgi:hydrogenase maturation factor HypF (carbamoyltransferase family)
LGGEFFHVTADSTQRIATLRPFRLPGGDSAVKEPRRAALGLLHELPHDDRNLLLQVQQKVASCVSRRRGKFGRSALLSRREIWQ